ncbi:MAG: hypothetical protein ACSHX6_04950 [Akkermansiaceae bacterium]
MKLTQLLTLPKLMLLGLTVSLSSCSEDKKETTESTQPKSEVNALASYLLKESPADAVDIADLRKSASAGDTVTFTGKAMGKHSVFMDDRAIMVLGDPKKITSCDLLPGDNCKTPWDVCCDDRDVINATIVTVQIVDDAGKPLSTGIKGLGDIKELTEVIVTGKVADGSNEKNMVINATGIFVKN